MKTLKSQFRDAYYSQKNKDKCRRAFDVVTASAVAAFTSPVLAFAAVSVMACNGMSSPLFKQERVGKGGKPFTIYKLKTYDDQGKLLKCARTIRALKIDELPQMYNVLRGDMAMVGPRPHVPSDPISQLKWRQEEMPGITSRAKLLGGNNIPHVTQAVLERNEKRKCDKMGVGGIIIYNTRVCFETPLSVLKNIGAPTSYDVAGHSTALAFGKGKAKRILRGVFCP